MPKTTRRATQFTLCLLIVATFLFTPQPLLAADGKPDIHGLTDTYIAKRGDTLFSIALDHGMHPVDLAHMNQMSLAEAIYVGEAIRIPAADTVLAGTMAGPLMTVDLRQYTVQPGDSIGSIAARYGTEATAIARLNNLVNPSLIVPGQELQIPPGGYLGQHNSIVMGEDGYHKHLSFPTMTEKWIDVDLSEQRVVAYEGTSPTKTFIISSGRNGTPTVTGTFRIWAKNPAQLMSGPGYYLPNVQWVQYFYQDYSFHGTYWHSNFGAPMSHGCINMTNADAKWLYDWASPENPDQKWLISENLQDSTLVVVHY